MRTSVGGTRVETSVITADMTTSLTRGVSAANWTESLAISCTFAAWDGRPDAIALLASGRSMEPTPLDDPDDPCFAGGGECGEASCAGRRGRRRPLGSSRGWPRTLRTLVPIMLASRFAMRLLWGPEMILLYNDRYRPVLGPRKHPQAMGRPIERRATRRGALAHGGAHVRARHGRRDRGSRRRHPAAQPHRVSRGVLLHPLVQPDPRRGRARARRARGGARDDREGARRTPPRPDCGRLAADLTDVTTAEDAFARAGREERWRETTRTSPSRSST